MERSDLPEGWEWRKLGDSEVCMLNPRKSEVSSLPDGLEVTFVPMVAVDAGKGAITDPQIRRFGEVRKGFTYFAEGDVLFAKITPSMENGKSAIARGLKNGIGFGTTEFHVLRPGPNVIAEWLYQFVRQKSFREEAASYMTGTAGQQRVPAEFLAEVEIPLPPLPEQRRIVARIEEFARRVEEARGLRREAVEWVEAVLPAARQNIFNAENLEAPVSCLEELTIRITKGESPAWQGFTYQESGALFVRSENVLWGKLDLSHPIYIPVEFHRKLSRSQLRAGDVLINLVGASIGRSCVVPADIGDANVNQAVAVISSDPKQLDSEYLMHFLISAPAQKAIHGEKVETARPNISLGNLRNLTLPVPPLDQQRRIVAYLDGLQATAEAIRAAQAETQKELDALMPSVLAKAFRGEL